MRFARVPPTKAEGALLAHGLRAGGARFEKGRRLTAADIETMRAAGVVDIAVAFLAADDLPENDAAARVAGALCGDNLRAGKALSGRVNLFATARGVLSFDAAALTRLNLIDPAIAVAAAAPCRRVEEGEMTATIKIIPFAVARAVVEEAAIAGARLRVAPYRMRDAVLLQTTIDSTKESVLAKTRRVTEARLAAVGIEIVREIRLPHRREAIAAALHDVRPAAPDLILLAGAVAVGDENDEAPAGIRDGGGAIERVGMPVDPGNLLVLGRLENAVCVVLPGCAKSPQAGGFDLLLPRLAAGLPVSAADVAALGAGGLLREIVDRPRRRRAREEATIGAVVLAAGLSSRFGGANKLLADFRGRPLAEWCASAVARARAAGVFADAVAVVGRDAEATGALFAREGARVVCNDDYRSGLASSLACGLRALAAECDAALILLADMPLVAAADIEKIVAAFDAAAGLDIAIPTYQGKRGNPVMLGRRHFDSLCRLRGDAGARAIFGAHAESVIEVECDEGVLRDWDSPWD